MNKLEYSLREKYTSVLHDFDWKTAEKVMKFLNWTWVGIDGTPTKDDMIGACNELFSYVIPYYLEHRIDSSASTGGFEVSIDRHECVEIAFKAVEACTYNWQ